MKVPRPKYENKISACDNYFYFLMAVFVTVSILSIATAITAALDNYFGIEAEINKVDCLVTYDICEPTPVCEVCEKCKEPERTIEYRFIENPVDNSWYECPHNYTTITKQKRRG